MIFLTLINYNKYKKLEWLSSIFYGIINVLCKNCQDSYSKKNTNQLHSLIKTNDNLKHFLIRSLLLILIIHSTTPNVLSYNLVGRNDTSIICHIIYICYSIITLFAQIPLQNSIIKDLFIINAISSNNYWTCHDIRKKTNNFEK